MTIGAKMERHLEYPDCSLYKFVSERAKAYPKSCALQYFSRKISYEKLIETADEYAELLSETGVKKGDNVSIILPNIPQAVFIFYAVNKLGAAANMIHPLSSRPEIEYYISLSRSRVIIALDSAAEKLSEIKTARIITVSPDEYMPFAMKTAYRISGHSVRTPYPNISTLMKRRPKTVADTGKGSDTAAILYSGGTTGKPKGIVLTNLNFNALAIQSIDGCGVLSQGDRVLSVMPIFHGFGLGVCIHTVLSLGGTAMILPKFRAGKFNELVVKYKPNVIAGVPSIYEYMLRSGFGKNRLDYLKCVISGGDSLSVSTKRKLDKVLSEHGCKAVIREGYGLTECVTGTCLMPEKCEKEGTVGLPYADMFYMIWDNENNCEMPHGDIGEIIMRGPTVMKGYLNDPNETALALRLHDDGNIWLHTGDLGFMDNDGYVYFRQRLKRVIVSNGYNIYPQGIENVISSFDFVTECAVVGIPDEIRGEYVKAFAVLKDGITHEEAEKKLREKCAECIASYAVPREYEFRDLLPKTLVGKVAYNELVR